MYKKSLICLVDIVLILQVVDALCCTLRPCHFVSLFSIILTKNAIISSNTIAGRMAYFPVVGRLACDSHSTEHQGFGN